MAEIELNVLTGQYLNRRVDNIGLYKENPLPGRSTETLKELSEPAVYNC